ncbi:MAG: Gfo/Idh/MocA family oxidoreductase [Candidatus Marinimicrobia bacterium]|nr:Gfo/Idh/MocA family oxidoreductase [Candidatus Neomarinimicrobiota bacterium]
MARRKKTFGIIGCGSRGINCFGRLLDRRDDVEIKALCDPNIERMKAMQPRLQGAQNLYTDVREMIGTEGLDAVVVTSPDYAHEANVVAALQAGAHVLVDKPLATTVAGCQQIIRTAAETERIVYMGFNLRHVRTLKRLKELVDAGALGQVHLIENREFYDGGKTYMARWNRLYEYSGGLWVHKGSHDFDVMQWLLGFPKPVKVAAFAGVNVLNPEHIPFAVKPGVPVGPNCTDCPYQTICPDVAKFDEPAWRGASMQADNYVKDLCMYTSDKDTHDNGIALVEYDNGCRGSHLESFIGSYSDRMYTLVGDKGMAEVSLHKRTILIRPRWSQETILHEIPADTGGHGGSDPQLVDSFVKVLRGERENTSTIEQGLWSTAVGQAAEISRRENRVVRINELMK